MTYMIITLIKLCNYNRIKPVWMIQASMKFKSQLYFKKSGFERYEIHKFEGNKKYNLKDLLMNSVPTFAHISNYYIMISLNQ